MFAAEAKLEKKSCSYATKLGWEAIKLKSASRNGRFDRMFIRGRPRLRVVFVEFKAPGGHPTSLQRVEHGRLLLENLEAYFCDDFEEFKAIIAD